MSTRPELEPLPPRMQSLLIDERGYPIPWFVDYLDGKPEFRAMDMRKFIRALKERLCWVCGQPLGRNMTFLAGPMCGINRTSSEPPNHQECARWSARNCPFLNNPSAVRREDELINNQDLRERAAGMSITRNPGVAMLWTTRSFEVFRPPSQHTGSQGGYLITMGAPESVEWYACGRLATRQDVENSIESGFPSLVTVAMQEPGALIELQRMRASFEKWLPIS